jgi:hypothetical protein
MLYRDYFLILLHRHNYEDSPPPPKCRKLGINLNCINFWCMLIILTSYAEVSIPEEEYLSNSDVCKAVKLMMQVLNVMLCRLFTSRHSITYQKSSVSDKHYRVSGFRSESRENNIYPGFIFYYQNAEHFQSNINVFNKSP